METWSPTGVGTIFGAEAQKPPGEGWTLTGYSQNRIAMNPNRMGSGFRTVQVPIYTRQTQQQAAPPPAPAPAPAAETQAPVTANNTYTDRITDLEKQLETAQKTAAAPDFDAINRATEQRYTDMINQLKIDSANQMKTLSDQYNMTISGFKNEMTAQADRYAQDLAKVAESQRTFQANQARGGQEASLQLQPATDTPPTAGTQAFKRRTNQFKIEKVFSGLNIGQPSTLNI